MDGMTPQATRGPAPHDYGSHFLFADAHAPRSEVLLSAFISPGIATTINLPPALARALAARLLAAADKAESNAIQEVR